jgi:uncharacterized membrane protein
VRIEVSVEIGRPPDLVWPVLIDVERWPEWTASVTGVERLDRAPFGMGSRVRIRQPRLKTMVWQVSEFQPGKLFIWQARNVGISVIGCHQIRPGEGGSTVTLRVDQSGWLSPILKPFFAPLTQKYVDMEASGLKKRCEELMVHEVRSL